MTMQTNEPVMAAGQGPGGGPSGYGMPPGGYGAPPGGAPPGGAPPGHPPGGFGAVPAQPPGGAPPAAKKGGKGGLIAGIVVALLAVAGGGAAAWYFWLNSTGPELAKYMPKDTELYMEVPSLTKALVGFVDLDAIDDSELDSGKMREDAVKGLADAFDIKKEEAEAILKGVKSVGLGLRNFEKKPEGSFMMSFSSAGDLEPLLSSDRFEKDGSLAGGTKYKLTKRKVDADDKKDMNAFEKAFSEMGDRKKDKDEDDDDDKKNACVFWEDKALFACGDVDYIEDVGKVVSGDKENLQKDNEKFKAAKWPGKSSILVFFDTSAIKEDEVRKGFFADGAPILGSMRFTDAGMVLQARAELSGKKLPKADLYPESPPDLSLADRLPADTVTYLAFSTKTAGSYKDYEKSLLKSLEESDENAAKQFEKMTESMDKELGFTLETIYDAVGEEGVLAFTATDKVTFEMIKEKDQDALDELGMVLALHIKDEDKANKIIKNLREKIEEKAQDAVEISKKDSGFVATPKLDSLPLPSVSVSIEDSKYLLVAVGKSKKRMEAIKSAFAGDGDLLKDDKAHQKAKKALGGKNWAFFWIDTGRIAKMLLKGNTETKDSIKEQGFNLSALVLEGDNRITSATAMRMDLKDETWIIEIEDLNGSLGSLGGLAAFGVTRSSSKSAIPENDDEPATPTAGSGDYPVVGIATCDEYIAKMQKCIKGAPASAQKSMADGLKTGADAWKQAASNSAARAAIEGGCKSALDSLKNIPFCPQ